MLMKKLITKSKQLLFVLAALVMGAGTAWADTVTVCDGTTPNEKVPFDGYNADSQQHNQMIYPSTMLTDMTSSNL